MNALYQAKQSHPELEIYVLVDWHRAQRGRIGAAAVNTNADWYCDMAAKHPNISVPVYGVPVNTREALGVLHLKALSLTTPLFIAVPASMMSISIRMINIVMIATS